MRYNSKLIDAEVCPLCNSDMIIKNGKYGMFWSCKARPKCKENKTIERLKELSLVPLEFYGPDTFLTSEPFIHIKIC